MTRRERRLASLDGIDDGTRLLVRVSAAVAGADEQVTRLALEAAVDAVDPAEVDEVILQSYLFAGFPRTLNAARLWRAVSGVAAPHADETAEIGKGGDWVERGIETCRTVYGDSYEMLRRNIRDLHPALDLWMITDGYGKVLSRPQLDLRTRELCIVAACAASTQQRQLHSHLHGALNAGASRSQVAATLHAVADFVPPRDMDRYQSLLDHAVAKRHPPRGQEE